MQKIDSSDFLTCFSTSRDLKKRFSSLDRLELHMSLLEIYSAFRKCARNFQKPCGKPLKNAKNCKKVRKIELFLDRMSLKPNISKF